MISRLLIGDNNLSKFWPAYQFSRPTLKLSTLITATDLDALDGALSQVEDKNQVIVSVLTSILIDEVNQNEVGSSAFNICEQAVSRLVGLCPANPSCQVLFAFFCQERYFFKSDLSLRFSVTGALHSVCFSFVCPQFFLAPPERCITPRWYSSAYQGIYDALVKLVPRFPSNLHLLPIYSTDFTMFESG